MVSKYRLCRIGASVGASTGVIILFYLFAINTYSILSKMSDILDSVVTLCRSLPYHYQWILFALFWVVVIVWALYIIVAEYTIDTWGFYMFCKIICSILGICVYIALVITSPFSSNDTTVPWLSQFTTAYIPAGLILLSTLLYKTKYFRFCEWFKEDDGEITEDDEER